METYKFPKLPDGTWYWVVQDVDGTWHASGMPNRPMTTNISWISTPSKWTRIGYTEPWDVPHEERIIDLQELVK